MEHHLILTCSKNDIVKYKNTNNYSLCDLNQSFQFQNYNTIAVIDSGDIQSGNISQDGFYKTLIVPCTNIMANLSLYLVYSNSNSTLSSNVQKYLQSLPIFIVLLSLIFFIWAINWIFNFSFKNYFHLFLTIFFLINIIYKTLGYFDLKSQSKSDINISIFSNQYQVIHFFKIFILYMVTTIGVSGISFVYTINSLKVKLSYFMVNVIFNLLSTISCLYLKNHFDDDLYLTDLISVYLDFYYCIMIALFIVNCLVNYDFNLGSRKGHFLKWFVIFTVILYNILMFLNEHDYYYTPFEHFYLTNLSLNNLLCLK